MAEGNAPQPSESLINAEFRNRIGQTKAVRLAHNQSITLWAPSGLWLLRKIAGYDPSSLIYISRDGEITKVFGDYYDTSITVSANDQYITVTNTVGWMIPFFFIVPTSTD